MTRILRAVTGVAALAAMAASGVPASANPPIGGPSFSGPRMGGFGPHAMGAWRGPVGPRIARPGGPRGGAWGWNRPYAGWRNGYGFPNAYGYGCRGGWGCAGWSNAGWGWGGSAVVVNGAPAGAVFPPVDPGPPSLPVGGVLPSPIGAPVLYRIDDRSRGARGSSGAKIISIGKPEPMPGVAASTYSNGVGRPLMYTLVAE
jgi:hypothetical protein